MSALPAHHRARQVAGALGVLLPRLPGVTMSRAVVVERADGGFALVDVYPLGGRWSLFLVPSLSLLFARGAYEIVASSRRRALVGVPLIALLAGVPVGGALGKAVHPPTRENIRPLLQRLDRSWRSGDTLYVYRNAQYALRFYGECAHCGVRPYPFKLRLAPPGADNAGFPAALVSNAPSVIVGTGPPTAAERLEQLDSLRGHRRLWLLFQRRNLIVHRRGIVDHQYNEKTGETLSLGSQLWPAPYDVENYLEAAAISGAHMLSEVNNVG